MTDEGGRYEFTNLPPGKYFLRALKAGYMVGDYGSTGFEKPPLPVALAAGDKIADATIVMSRGAVIAGRIVGKNGTPAVGVHVAAVTRQFVNGQMRYVSAGATETDDRGAYRLFGLPPASYAVAALLRDMTSERAPSEHSPDDALSQTAGPGTPSILRPVTPNSAASYLNAFFPGTVDPAGITWLTLRAGEERADVDFPLGLARSGTLAGEVTLADGLPARNTRVVAYASGENLSLGSGDFGTRAMTSANGRFAFGGIQPGTYTLVASTTDGSQLAGVTRIQVNGSSIGPVRVLLGPAATVSGQVALQAKAAHAPALTSIRVLLRPVTDLANDGVPQSTQPDIAGNFAFRNVVPGAYYVDALVQGPSPRLSEWIVKTASAGSHNLRSEPLVVQQGDRVQDLLVSMTDSASEFSGRVLDGAGKPLTDRYVVMFATDPSLWRVGSGHMRAPIRPATDGTFSFNRLPEGNYYVAVLNDFEPEAWHDRSFLQQLIPSALTIELNGGEKKVQDLRLR